MVVSDVETVPRLLGRALYILNVASLGVPGPAKASVLAAGPHGRNIMPGWKHTARYERFRDTARG
jgi:hypothetical protein